MSARLTSFARTVLNTADSPRVAVLLCAGRRLPRALRGLPVLPIADKTDVDAAIGGYSRLVVVGGDADLAAVLARLLRAERLDVAVAQVTSRWGARRALTAAAQRVPLIRDETGAVLVGAATWRGDGGPLRGEAIVDDTVLFDGDAPGVRVEPTAAPPGVRAGVMSRGGRVRRWASGRAAQLGSTGALVVRDGVPAPRPVRRSAFYRHTQDWLRVG